MEAKEILNYMKRYLESDIEMFEMDYVDFEYKKEDDLMLKAKLCKRQCEKYLFLINSLEESEK